MAFEVFKETGSRNKEFISITEKSAFGMSRPFLDKHEITNSHKAVILFDPDTMQVALYFSTLDPEFGFAVRIPNLRHGGVIVAKSFFDIKGIDPKKYAGRYPDFEIKNLSDLGIEKPGKAYVIKLVERNDDQADDGDQIDFDGIDDKPIDISEIPF